MCNINAVDVKKLRERTGVGMMECKKALTEANGNMDKAVEYLREKGLATAAKKAMRIAAEGLVNAYVDAGKKVGVLLEINCETDFVAMNTDFQKLVQDITEMIAAKNPVDITALSTLPITAERTIGEIVTEMVQTLGENINIRRFVRYETNGMGAIHSYIHSDALTKGKEGVILECAVKNAASVTTSEFVSILNDLALQISAYKPEYIRREDVPVDILEREKAIYKAQAMNEGKPEAIAEKIMQGRIEKFYREVCLLEQPYLRDDSKSVNDILQEMNTKLGQENISITRFTRYEKGEGIEKKKDDFAAEVMGQING